METINPVGNTSCTSRGMGMRQSEKQQGLLADLGPSSPSPPRAAAVAHQIHQGSQRHLFAMHPAPPGGHGANDGQTLPRQENPLHDLSWEHMVQALNTGVYARFDCISPPPSCLRTIDAAVQPTGLAQEHPPPGESPRLVPPTGQISAPLFGGARKAPSSQPAMASGGEYADLLDLVAKCLLSDDFEVYDPEDSTVRAMMADYEAAFLNMGAPSPTGSAQGYSPPGESHRPAPATGQIGASPIGEDLEGQIGQAIMTSGGEHVKRPAGDRAYRLSADQRRAILHVFKTDSKRSSQSIAKEFSVSPKTIRVLRERYGQTGDIKPGDHANRLAGDQRRAVLHIFKTDSKRSSQSIAKEFSVTPKTIRLLREKFSKTGDIQPGNRAKRLTVDQRRAILHIFETDPKRSNKSIADEFGVSSFTIALLRRQPGKIESIKPVDHAKRLTGDQRRAILHIFETDPERSNQSVADEFGVDLSTINRLRKRFNKTGDIKPGNYAKRLTGDQRRAIVHIFETDPERNNQSVASEFDLNLNTIQVLRRQFGKTGNIQPGDSAKRLTADQRRAILHIFETDIERSNQSLADEFDVSLSTINRLRNRFSKTGNVKPRDCAKRLTVDQRRAIVHIFETDPERNNQLIADEFDVNLKTIQVLRRKFRMKGNIQPGDRTKRLTADQRQAIVHIFETDPERSSQSIAEEFDVAYLTIYRSRKKFSKT